MNPGEMVNSGLNGLVKERENARKRGERKEKGKKEVMRGNRVNASGDKR